MDPEMGILGRSGVGLEDLTCFPFVAFFESYLKVPISIGEPGFDFLRDYCFDGIEGYSSVVVLKFHGKRFTAFFGERGYVCKRFLDEFASSQFVRQ
jgi:hypothetical protein